MTARTTASDPWSPVFHRGRFEMIAFTRRFFLEEHALLLGTEFAAEIRADDQSAHLLHFVSASSMAEFVREMVPTLIEINRADGEDVTELAAMLQTAWDQALALGRQAAAAAIARASGR